MTKARKAAQLSPPTSYELLAGRLQKAINAPAAQLSRSVILERHATDSLADWERILGEISENDNVTIAHRDNGFAHVHWSLPAQD